MPAIDDLIYINCFLGTLGIQSNIALVLAEYECIDFVIGFLILKIEKERMFCTGTRKLNIYWSSGMVTCTPLIALMLKVSMMFQ